MIQWVLWPFSSAGIYLRVRDVDWISESCRAWGCLHSYAAMFAEHPPSKFLHVVLFFFFKLSLWTYKKKLCLLTGLCSQLPLSLHTCQHNWENNLVLCKGFVGFLVNSVVRSVENQRAESQIYDWHKELTRARFKWSCWIYLLISPLISPLQLDFSQHHCWRDWTIAPGRFPSTKTQHSS